MRMDSFRLHRTCLNVLRAASLEAPNETNVNERFAWQSGSRQFGDAHKVDDIQSAIRFRIVYTYMEHFPRSAAFHHVDRTPVQFKVGDFVSARLEAYSFSLAKVSPKLRQKPAHTLKSPNLQFAVSYYES
jgi:hypothetical protein